MACERQRSALTRAKAAQKKIIEAATERIRVLNNFPSGPRRDAAIDKEVGKIIDADEAVANARLALVACEVHQYMITKHW